MPGGRPPADLVVVSPVWTEAKKVTTKRALRMLRDEFTNAVCTNPHGTNTYCFECINKDPALLKDNEQIVLTSNDSITHGQLHIGPFDPCTLCGDSTVHKVWL